MCIERKNKNKVKSKYMKDQKVIVIITKKNILLNARKTKKPPRPIATLKNHTFKRPCIYGVFFRKEKYYCNILTIYFYRYTRQKKKQKMHHQM